MTALQLTAGFGTGSWILADGLQSGRDARAGHFQSVAGHAPAGAGHRMTLNGLVAAVFRTTARNVETVGRDSAFAGLVLHNGLHVLARRFDQRLHALRSASVRAAFEAAVAVLVRNAFVVAAVHRHGHQERTLPTVMVSIKN